MNRRLPIGVQSFELLRNDGYIYIDKTMYIKELSDVSREIFLSRPRRFGKSLLTTTLEAYFLGKKELFSGLYIENEEAARGKDAWTEYPVISFYLSGGIYTSKDGLEQVLRRFLNKYRDLYDIKSINMEKDKTDLPNSFASLIEELYEKTKKRVVILVDEYDKPLLPPVDGEQREKNRELYKSFFSVLKDQDKYIKFAFFTGVTKFSKISIFSDLNQLKDISFLDRFSGICGITEKEMKDTFEPEIREMAKSEELSYDECLKKLSDTYDGYHFSKRSDGVYNPFSLLNALSDREFGSYWFESGTPTFLIEKLRGSSFRPEQFVDGTECSEAELKDYRTDDPNPLPLLYQSGYLTIKDYDKDFETYLLSFPNSEVRYGFLKSLVPYVLGERDLERPVWVKRIVIALREGDIETLHDELYSLFASIPYVSSDVPKYEEVWRNQIYIIFALLSQYVTCEQHTAEGRSDCVVETPDYIYLFEFKVNRSADEALEQIDQKDYSGRYRSDKRKLFKIGVNFLSEKRNIGEWKVKELCSENEKR